MDCAWFATLAGVWLAATVDTVSFAVMSDDPEMSIVWLTDVAYEGMDFADRLRGCGLDDKVIKIEVRARAMMTAAHRLEGKLR